jgi:hypothetical protein
MYKKPLQLQAEKVVAGRPSGLDAGEIRGGVLMFVWRSRCAVIVKVETHPIRKAPPTPISRTMSGYIVMSAGYLAVRFAPDFFFVPQA